MKESNPKHESHEAWKQRQSSDRDFKRDNEHGTYEERKSFADKIAKQVAAIKESKEKKENKHPKDYKTTFGNGRSDEENREADQQAIRREIKEKFGNPYK